MIRCLLSSALKLVAVLLVAGMIFHDAAAVAHPVVCPAGHEHAPTADPSGGLAMDAEMSPAADGTHDHGSDRNMDTAVPCHGALIGCFGCLSGEAVGLASPPIVRSVIPPTPVFFSSTQPGVEHRPPKAAA